MSQQSPPFDPYGHAWKGPVISGCTATLAVFFLVVFPSIGLICKPDAFWGIFGGCLIGFGLIEAFVLFMVGISPETDGERYLKFFIEDAVVQRFGLGPNSRWCYERIAEDYGFRYPVRSEDVAKVYPLPDIKLDR